MRGLTTRLARKKHLLTSYRYGSADQSTFCIIWFSIKLQNIIINQIHFNTSLRGLYLGGRGGGSLK